MVKKESFIKLKTEIIKGDDNGKIYYVASIKEPTQLSGAIIQVDSEEEIEPELLKTVKIILDFYQEESIRYSKTSIFRGNIGRNQLWFTIIGIGLMINWIPSKYNYMKEVAFGWKNFGVTKRKGLRLGNLSIYFNNEWTK